MVVVDQEQMVAAAHEHRGDESPVRRQQKKAGVGPDLRQPCLGRQDHQKLDVGRQGRQKAELGQQDRQKELKEGSIPLRPPVKIQTSVMAPRDREYLK
jgi:hypothetical protein